MTTKTNSGEWFVLRRVPCPTCNGDGLVWRGNNQESCPRCEEVGYSTIEVPLIVALRDLGIDVEVIRRAQQDAQRAADVASMLANGILPD